MANNQDLARVLSKTYNPADFYTGSMTPPTSSGGVLRPTQLSAVGTGSGTGTSQSGLGMSLTDPGQQLSFTPGYGFTQLSGYASDAPTQVASGSTDMFKDQGQLPATPPASYDYGAMDPMLAYGQSPQSPALAAATTLSAPTIPAADPWGGMRIGAAPVPKAGLATGTPGGLAALKPVDTGPSYITAAPGMNRQQTHDALMGQQNKAVGNANPNMPTSFASDNFGQSTGHIGPNRKKQAAIKAMRGLAALGGS